MPTFNGTESLGLRSVRSGNTKTVAAPGWCFRTAFAATLGANRQPGVSQPCRLNLLGMTERVVQPGFAKLDSSAPGSPSQRKRTPFVPGPLKPALPRSRRRESGTVLPARPDTDLRPPLRQPVPTAERSAPPQRTGAFGLVSRYATEFSWA